VRFKAVAVADGLLPERGRDTAPLSVMARLPEAEGYLARVCQTVYDAVSTALAMVVGQSQLPMNPALLVAKALFADHHVAYNADDRLDGSGQREPQLGLSSLSDNRARVIDARRGICTLDGVGVWALPHIAAVLDDIAPILHAILHAMPEAFLGGPGMFPCSSTGVTAQSFCSLQMHSLLRTPTAPPALHVRADILISGGSEEAVEALGAIVFRDCQAILKMPLNTLVDVAMMPNPSCVDDDNVEVQDRISETAADLLRQPQLLQSLARKAALRSQVLTSSAQSPTYTADQSCWMWSR
jgi:hypothetical protein